MGHGFTRIGRICADPYRHGCSSPKAGIAKSAQIRFIRVNPRPIQMPTVSTVLLRARYFFDNFID
jgi:hypothetical protein